MRTATAIVTIATGRKGTIQLPPVLVENYTIEQSIDNDADSFSVDIGDIKQKLAACTERDNEVRLSLFLTDLAGQSTQIFQGIADDAVYGEDRILSLEGRDEPSSLAVDSDAVPGRWKHINPKPFIAARAKNVNIANVQIATMATMVSLYTDGSEKEWAFWYRIARARDMYMWSNNVGKLIIDKLAYSLAPTYFFGDGTSQFIKVETAKITSAKQTRIRKSFVYGDDAKKGKAFVAQSIDTSIASWRKQPLTVSTSTTAKTQAEAKKEADENVFESIVGAQEYELTIQDTGVLILQNRMAQVNLPEQEIVGTFFIVGVRRAGGPDGLTQVVRLREKGFAITERVPTAPVLTKNPKGLPDIDNRPATSIGAALSGSVGQYADSFVRATQEYHGAWNFSTFLGVLLSICANEGNFHNVREKSGDSSLNGIEWYPQPDGTSRAPAPGVPGTAQSPVPGFDPGKASLADLVTGWKKTFANSSGNPYNPFKGTRPNDEAGVGPMQLTSRSIKEFADGLGDIHGRTAVDEYAGGRWNPDSNIRAAAKLLVDKLNADPPADPTIDDNIWIGVERYNGSGPAAQAYAARVKADFKSVYATDAASAVQAVKNDVPGSGQKTLTWQNDSKSHSVDITSPANAPNEVDKALTWLNSMMGDPYVLGGAGPHYDCSSLVTKALSLAAPYLHALLAQPPGLPNSATNAHGQNTYSLIKLGKAVSKSNLLPGDLVFFLGTAAAPEHVGCYIGDGMYVSDTHPGRGVAIDGIGTDWANENWVGARRLIDWPTNGPGTR